MRVKFALGLAVLFAIACQENEARRSTQAIIGGTLAPDDAAVVLLVLQTATSERYCSGTVIAPHVVLTAAHCLDPRVTGEGVTHYVFVGADLNEDAQANDAKRWIRTKSLHFDPDYDPEVLSGAHDIGLVVTKTKLAPTPLRLRRTPLDAQLVGAAVRVLGYGLTNPDDATSAGTRYQIGSTIRSVDAGELVRSDEAGQETCHGDSGGPTLYDDGEGEVILGVHSWGEHSMSCTGPDHDARIDPHDSFVWPIVEAADPGVLAPLPPPDLLPASDLSAPPITETGCGVARGAADGYALLLAMVVITSRRWWARRRCSTT